jgi:hypothetical protein
MRVFTPDRETSMQTLFRTQAEYWLRLAHVADAEEDKAQLFSMACAWHRLGQKLHLRDEVDQPRGHRTPKEAA